MAVPKRRVSRTRRDKRRTHWKAKMPTLTVCPNCYEPKRPHRICPYCGYYKDSEVINVKVK